MTDRAACPEHPADIVCTRCVARHNAALNGLPLPPFDAPELRRGSGEVGVERESIAARRAAVASVPDDPIARLRLAARDDPNIGEARFEEMLRTPIGPDPVTDMHELRQHEPPDVYAPIDWSKPDGPRIAKPPAPLFVTDEDLHRIALASATGLQQMGCQAVIVAVLGQPATPDALTVNWRIDHVGSRERTLLLVANLMRYLVEMLATAAQSTPPPAPPPATTSGSN